MPRTIEMLKTYYAQCGTNTHTHNVRRCRRRRRIQCLWVHCIFLQYANAPKGGHMCTLV